MEAQTAMRIVERHAGECQYASVYGEPGYDDPEGGILLANWNKVPKTVQEGLARRGFELEWFDEWTLIGCPEKAYRTKGDCYAWTQYYVWPEDGDPVGGDKIENDEETRRWYVEEYLLDDPTHCNLFRIDFAAMGFIRLEPGYETGFHPGQTDDPKKVFEQLQAKMPGKEFLFDLTSTGQFDIGWQVWARDEQP